METTDQNKKSKPRRGCGPYVHEIAKMVKISRYKAKQAVKLDKLAREKLAPPEILDRVISGELKLKQALEIVEHVPELIPYVIKGKLPFGRERDRIIRELRQLKEPEPELTFDEEVEQSFKRWLSKWPKEDRREVIDIVEMMPLEKLVDLVPSQAEENLVVVKNDLETEPSTKAVKPKKENE